MTFPTLDPKDPDAEVYYEWDFSNWLAAGETISSYSFPDFPAALTNEGDSETGGIVQMKISGGVDGESYDLTCRIVTNTPQTEDRTFTLPVQET